MKPLHQLSAVEAARAVAGGETTSEKLVAACLERIAEREPAVRAWSAIDPETALAAARIRDQAGRGGALHGLPVGVKDIIDTCDMPTTCGSPIYTGHRPTVEAGCVALLREAGGIVMGKTVTTEFAMYTPGKTANPHDATRTPGGSSSGSAAAVAACMVPLAYGSQTAGSVIRPASFCGVVGYKATHGELPLAGVKGIAPTLDTLGAFSRRVADMGLVRHALVGAPAEVVPADGRLRVGLCRTPQWQAAEPATVEALEGAARNLEKAGAAVRDVTLPDAFDGLLEAQSLILPYEAVRTFADERRRHPADLSPRFHELLAPGLAASYADYRAAVDLARRCRRLLDDVFAEVDVLLAPSAAGEAPQGLLFTGDPVFNRIWSLLHVPAVSLPGHVGPNGMPVGVQVIGPIGGDDRLLAMAAWMEDRVA